MSPSEEAAQKINEEHRLMLAANASHNYRAALAESQNRVRKWKIAFWLMCFAALVAVNVWKWL